MCPNGHNCQFRHCLPQGYVFKGQEEVIERKGPSDKDMIDELDQERDRLDQTNLKLITKEVFDKWLERRTIQLDKDRKKRIE